MIYDTFYGDLFFAHFEKFTLKERRLIESKIDFLKVNPYHPSLRTQKLRKYDDNLYESSVSMDIRLIWRLKGSAMIFEDVGRHDILKKYG